MPQSHDQNFKNLILDSPREALQLFADTEADQVDAAVRILPLREQQLKERLGDRFRELDVPLLLEWPDGRRAALLQLEPDPERQIKYLDFIDIYADLDDNERVAYQQRYAQEATIMSGFAERFIQKGHAEGRAEGRQEEGVSILTRLLTLKFGPLNDETRQRVQQADPDTLVRWAQRVLTVADIEDVFDGAEHKGA